MASIIEENKQSVECNKYESDYLMSIYMEAKLKHLELIQGIINRLSSDSFMLKGWAVTLVAGIFVLAEKDTNKMYFFVSYIPIIVFWILDSYYLMQEKLYRALYSVVCEKSYNKVDFSMKTEKGSIIKYCGCLISVTEVGFYIPLWLVCCAVVVLSFMIG